MTLVDTFMFTFLFFTYLKVSGIVEDLKEIKQGLQIKDKK